MLRPTLIPAESRATPRRALSAPDPSPRAPRRRRGDSRSPRLAFALAIAAGAGGLVSSCSLLLDTGGEQCARDQDCLARGGTFADTRCVNKVCVVSDGGSDTGADGGAADTGTPDAYDPKWGCLGNVKPPTFPNPKVNVSVPLVDLISKKPVTAIDARPCGKTDVACATPLGPTVQPNASGILSFVVDAGFDGYIELKSTNVDGGLPAYLPSLVFFNPPLSVDTIYISIPLISPVALGGLAAQFGNAIDPSLGAPFAEVVDCLGKAADGVGVAVDQADASTRTFYFVNGLPTESTTQTDQTGYSGFINTPIGVRTITGTVRATSKRVGTISVLVRPSTLTYTVLPPTP